MTPAEYIAANETRRAKLNAQYDPYVGIGSPLDRVRVPLGRTVVSPLGTATDAFFVPSTMLEDNPALHETIKIGLAAFAEMCEVPFDVCERHLSEMRLRHDFEFWCAICVKIKLDAETRSRLQVVRGALVLNRAQRLYLAVLMRLFWSGVPIRIILLKARQWGGSTLTQVFFAWIQQYHRQGWNAFVCALDLKQAGHIRQMYETLGEEYPTDIGRITFKGYQGSQNIKYIPEVDSIIGVTSIERPDSPRSFSIHMAHLSEVGLWKSTPVINAEDFAQAITGAVPREPLTIIVEESTARGVGSYFHTHWKKANKGESSYEPIFVPWYEIPKYITTQPTSVQAFVESWDSYETRLWEKFECTLEQIAWYREKLLEFKGNRTKMKAEFPTTAEEAFQSTGSPYFNLEDVSGMARHTRPPAFIGQLDAKGSEGKAAFEEISFSENLHGGLSIWRRPDDDRSGLVRTDVRYVNRYAAFADFGGKTEKADWSVLTIIDRFPVLIGDVPEVVARMRVHVRPDIFAWMSARVAWWYGKALLAYEINRHSKDRGDDIRGYEPEWSLAVLEEIRGVYPNLFLRPQSGERIDEPQSMNVGFHTNTQTKPMILNVLDKAIEDRLYIERDERALDEMLCFEKKLDGKLGAVDGQHDDIVISTAGALWLAAHYMPPVAAVSLHSQRTQRKPSMATFN